jgi:ComF family protein
MRQMRNPLTCQSLISQLSNILYPSRCPLCGNSADVFSHAPVCGLCWSEIRRYTGPSCRVCALPFTSEHARLCGQCLKKSPPFSKVITYGLYEGSLREAINQFKFHGVRRLSKPLGSLLLASDLPAVDAVVPVPVTVRKLRERGFNQSLLLAKIIAKKIRVPLLMDTLLKKKETPPQIGLTARERLMNLRNAFTVKGSVDAMRLLLVDDVMTTGATVTECSKQLMKAGAEEVIVLTLARAGER